ncbi:uncharacterized protein MONBRDRAFT_37321 [Monosiga brevicollis MX1]|uniref:Aminotransferase class V domain-containing protein n=1 Tax=Monosiga brevicollis TaxID=81824 RepID=A9V108_MONBE|nr:uncharacterized protein MONBRDRAFT_37321 [Monosiga brevicollis MX1]EDQ88850.1 predicted protein [Monosiga brevicollis MX1]|eukprot:XP_001746463.1 hypothetical protein [Monosiga brevicollis MX1]
MALIQVLVLDQQMSSNVYAWQEILHRRCQSELHVVKRSNEEDDWTTLVLRDLQSLGAKVGLVAVPQFHWCDGAALDLVAISECCQQLNIPLVLDLTQSAGVVPLDWKRVRPMAVAASIHKWLLGPYGMCLAWLDRDFARHFVAMEAHEKHRVGADDEAWDNNGLMTTAGYPTAEIEGSQRLGVGGGVGVAAYIKGSEARAISSRLDPHEPLLAAAEKDGWVRQRRSIRFSSPITSSDTSHHVHGDLTIDCYANGITGDIDKKNFTLFVAPPSMVASRSIFLEMAPFVSNTFGVTEMPSFGVNQIDLRASQLNAEVMEHGLEQTLRTLQKEDPKHEGAYVVAAGHAGFYALKLAQRCPELFSSLVLLNPTFRGPLTTAAFNKQEEGDTISAMGLGALRRALWALMRIPFLGEALNAASNSPENIKKHLLSHVYSDEAHVTEEVVALNEEFALAGNHLPKAAFLTGQLDPLREREDLTPLLEGGFKVPTMILLGHDSPASVKADVQPLFVKADERAQTGEGERSIGVDTPGALRSFVEYPSLVGNLVRAHIQQYC